MTYANAFGITTAGMILMSFESPLIKMTHVSAQIFTFYFGLCMFISMNITLLLKYKRTIFALYKTQFLPILASGLCIALSNLFFILAIKHTSVASAVFILSTGPLISALIAFVFFKQKTPLRTFIAIFFVFIGLGIILFHDGALGNMKGNLYAFGCVFAFVSTLSILERNKEANRLACFGTGALMVSCFSFLTTSIVVPDAYSLTLIVGMGAFLTPLSRALIGIGTKILSSVEIALLTIIEPVLAPFWVWLLLGEAPHLNTLFGGAIIVLTLLIHSLKTHQAYQKS
ncbi:DMT family transporter [Sulfurospirillum barnesii]|uniref:Putative permease n=1 Tax=Sulfurospirillum barnesii (strain ATCC 700032 / DSM 10660 / SES-3) TaxID=760154 RepID=I3XUR2_SULBS|nr:DMT family transporter [Sulfurospirillum barnesii]AFL67686.1 putative permease [Sulfurospirillum barnesii SES-3]